MCTPVDTWPDQYIYCSLRIFLLIQQTTLAWMLYLYTQSTDKWRLYSPVIVQPLPYSHSQMTAAPAWLSICSGELYLCSRMYRRIWKLTLWTPSILWRQRGPWNKEIPCWLFLIMFLLMQAPHFTNQSRWKLLLRDVLLHVDKLLLLRKCDWRAVRELDRWYGRVTHYPYLSSRNILVAIVDKFVITVSWTWTIEHVIILLL